MKQTTKRFVSAVGGLMLVVGAMVVYFNLIKPANEDIQDLKSKVLGKEAFIKTQENAINEVKKLVDLYQDEKGRKLQDVISTALPTEEDISGMLAQMNGMMQASGLTLQSIAFSVGRGPVPSPRTASSSLQLVKPISNIGVQAQFTGNYENLKKFLKMIETNIRIFSVESLNVSPAGDKNNKDLFGYNLKITAYYQNL